MKWTSASLLSNFGLTTVLTDITIVTPACFLVPFVWNNFLYYATLRQCLSLMVKCVSYGQKKRQTLFSDPVCLFLLIEELKPLTFSYYWNVCWFLSFCWLCGIKYSLSRHLLNIYFSIICFLYNLLGVFIFLLTLKHSFQFLGLCTLTSYGPLC